MDSWWRNRFPSTGAARPVLARTPPNGSFGFVNDYEMPGVHHNASYLTVERVWDRLAVKQFDPLIKHKDADKELSNFLKWRDAHELLLIDEWTQAIYKMKLDQFERLEGACLLSYGGYHEDFFAYDSNEVNNIDLNRGLSQQ